MIALTNGMWFNGQEFVPKTMYSVDGYFTTQKPSTIDTTIDLTGKYVIPPFGEAHNHNLNGGNEANRGNIKRYLRDGVFYVKLQSNFPITDEEKKELRLNTPLRLAVSRGIVVVTTCKVVSMARAELLPDEQKKIALEVQRINLQQAREHGVTLAIGSDLVNDSSVEEVEYLRSLNIFSNLELLKMWTEVTAKAIFPDRKIGILDEGYEASFVALEGNPLEDFGNTRKIAIRFKQGRVLEGY